MIFGNFYNLLSQYQLILYTTFTFLPLLFSSFLPQINPPKLDDYQSDEEEEDEEDDTRPLTREELKTRTLNRLQRRGQQTGGAKASSKKKVPNSKMGNTR